jgi:hypothetical protein
MGIYAVKSAVLEAARLNLGNAAARLLFHMGAECWDEKRGEQEPRRYFAGRGSSAIALGYLAPRNESDAAHSAVKRAVRELIDLGLIRRVRSGGNGVPSEYELLLNSGRPGVSSPGIRESTPFSNRAFQGALR